MSVTIHEVLDQLRASALDERDKGDSFERLMQGYFRIDQQWAQQFSDVWLWSEWPGREGKPDTGIDLVAKERDTGELTAIQCKFYAPDTYIQKSHIDSFFTASGKTGFTRRIVVSTSDHWSKNAEDALTDQQVSTQRLDVSFLTDSTIDWDEFSWRTPSVLPTHGPKTLRPHQTAALEAAATLFDEPCLAVIGRSLKVDQPPLFRRVQGLFEDRNQIAHKGLANLRNESKLRDEVHAATEAVGWLRRE